MKSLKELISRGRHNLGQVQFTTPDGTPYQLFLKAGVDDAFHDLVRERGLFDHVPTLLWRLLDPGDIFLDLGANVGTVSVPLAAKGVRVYAFEILRENIQALERAREANGFKNLEVLRYAAWDAEGKVRIGGHSAWGSVSDVGESEVRSIRVDTFAESERLPRIDAIKIDIEGSERRALAGMRSVLARDTPDVVIEANVLTSGYSGYSFQELICLLEEGGFAIYRIFREVLAPFHSGDLQECISCDYLATVRPAAELKQRTQFEVRPMTSDEIRSSIMEQAGYPEVHWRYVGLIAEKAPEDIRKDPAVEELLEKWNLLSADERLTNFIRVGSSWPVNRVD